MKRLLSRSLIVAGVLAATAVPAHATFDINTLEELSQPEFRALSADLGAAMSYKGMNWGEQYGLLGFEAGVVVAGAKLNSPELLRKASLGDDAPTSLPMLNARIHKGLPYGLDVGVTLGIVLRSGVRNVGGELRWLAIDGSKALPPVSLRLSGTRLVKSEQLELRTYGVDVSTYKQFGRFTPYIGGGVVLTKSSNDASPTALRPESITQKKLFVGVNAKFIDLINILVEVDRTGATYSGGAKISLGFHFD